MRTSHLDRLIASQLTRGFWVGQLGISTGIIRDRPYTRSDGRAMSGNCDFCSYQSNMYQCNKNIYPSHDIRGRYALRSVLMVVYSGSGNDSPSPSGRPSQFRFLSAQDRTAWEPSREHIRPRWSCGTVECHRSTKGHGGELGRAGDGIKRGKSVYVNMKGRTEMAMGWF